MTKSPLDLGHAYRVLNPGCVVLVSVGDGETDNLFAVTWNMPVRKDPPLVALVSGKSHYSYPFIERTGELGINVLPADLADALYGCGKISGAKEPDKWARFGLSREPATRIDAPLVAEAVASLECRVCQVVDLGSSALLVAQVVAAAADPRHFSRRGWSFDEGLRLLHHLSGPDFAVSAEMLKAQAKAQTEVQAKAKAKAKAKVQAKAKAKVQALTLTKARVERPEKAPAEATPRAKTGAGRRGDKARA